MFYPQTWNFRAKAHSTSQQSHNSEVWGWKYGYRRIFPLFLTSSLNFPFSVTVGRSFKLVMFLCFFCNFVISILILSYQNTISLLFIIYLDFWAWFFTISTSKELRTQWEIWANITFLALVRKTSHTKVKCSWLELFEWAIIHLKGNSF